MVLRLSRDPAFWRHGNRAPRHRHHRGALSSGAYPPAHMQRPADGVADGCSRNIRKQVLWLAGSRSRSEEHTSELQSLMRHTYAVLCLKNQTQYLSTPTQKDPKE